jgi:hypothetical protein
MLLFTYVSVLFFSSHSHYTIVAFKAVPAMETSPSTDVGSQESEEHGTPCKSIAEENHVYGDFVRVSSTRTTPDHTWTYQKSHTDRPPPMTTCDTSLFIGDGEKARKRKRTLLYE